MLGQGRLAKALYILMFGKNKNSCLRISALKKGLESLQQMIVKFTNISVVCFFEPTFRPKPKE
jgi:hypothetical protein